MHTMNVSLWIEKVGHGIINTALLAALPVAAIASILQGF